MTTPSWAIGAGAEVKVPETAKPFRSTFRFFLKKGQEKSIIFLHGIEDAIVIFEHQYERMRRGKKDFNNFLTCLETTRQKCPMCQYAEDYGKGGRSVVQLFSVLDLTPWQGRDGVKHLYSKVILAAKKGTQELLVRKHMERLDAGNNGLKHAKFKVFRNSSDAKAPVVGTEYTFLKYAELAGKIPEEDILPVDLNEFAPAPERMRDVVSMLRGGTGPSVSGPSGGSLLDDDDYDIPGQDGPVSEIEVDY